MTSSISGIEFGTLSAKQVRKLSVVQITAHDVFDKGVPKYGGLSDLRLGTIDRQFKCHTCKHDALGCAGHFGHIELASPVYHISFVKTIVKVLQCVCVECGELKADTNFQSSNNARQFKYVHELCKSKNICPTCEYVQPKILNDKVDILYEYDSKTPTTPGDILKLFSKLSDTTLRKMGFGEDNHPRNMILEVLPVPPPHVRPSVNMDASLKSQDDLTHKLSEIVKTNSLLIKQLQNSESDNTSDKAIKDLLQYHVTTYIDNGIPGINQATQRTGRPIKAICQRLKSKEGRFRGNLMGKRVNFSARTVITAEPNIALDELGVPWKIAKILTYPEHVTEINIRRLQNYINNGHDPEFGLTGAKLVHQDGIQKDIRFVSNIRLKVGDIVERHIKDGDVVVFNRQPSLHKMSMMGHKVKVMKHDTFRMNVCATTPYNADYDGDEMNVHAPQSEAARAEIKELMMISKCIVSPQSNKPVIGIIQDALLGCHKITRRDVFITKAQFCDVLLRCGQSIALPPPALIRPKELFTGKQLVQCLFPSSFSFERNGSVYTDGDVFNRTDGKTIIKNGHFISGNLCKKSLGTSEGGIVHLLWLEYGPETANAFISNIQYLVNSWLNEVGFSIGAMDIFVDKCTESRVFDTINKAKEKVSQIISVCKDNPKMGKTHLYENKINQTLNNAMSQAGVQVQENINYENNINATVTGGSKGSMFNIAQIMGCVGQQNVNGQRVNFGYVDRVLTHFERGDIGPEAKGFVENSYKNGLKPHEFFYHAMGGREGIVDTAIKTAETGYIQRRLVKAMEDLTVGHDKAVRNAIGDVIQFVYGGDGFDATYLIKDTLHYCNPRSQKFIDMFIHDDSPSPEIEYITCIMDNLKSTVQFHSPLLLSRISLNRTSGKVVAPDVVFEKVSNMCNSWSLYAKNRASDRIATLLDSSSLQNIRASVQLHLNSKTVCIRSKLSDDDLDVVLRKIDWRFYRSLAQNGEMIGTIAAQSLGEPCTQLTLNTFHAAGISAKNVTLGVPRFKELINVSKNIKSPSMSIPILPQTDPSTDIDEFAATIESVTLNMITSSSRIVETDVQQYNYMEIPDTSPEIEGAGYFSHAIRYYIDKDRISSKRLSILDVTVRIMQAYEALHCIGSDDNDPMPWIDVLIYNDDELSVESVMILNSKLKYQEINGISSVKKVYVDKDKCLLETDGTCLQQMFDLSFVDKANCISNDVVEVKDILGIEAARSLLLKEMRTVLEFDGTYINSRHFHTLVDTMTYKGGIMAITRHGINKSDNGPLMKCSFEETIDVLTEAASFGETDLLKGVTENITVGKMASMGTGTFDLRYPCNEQFDDDQFIDEQIESQEYTPLAFCSDDEYITSHFE